MKITIEKSYDVASCNNCTAKTYDSPYAKDNNKVEFVYEVRIGNMVNRLCPDCLAELIGKATVALATDK